LGGDGDWGGVDIVSIIVNIVNIVKVEVMATAKKIRKKG